MRPARAGDVCAPRAAILTAKRMRGANWHYGVGMDGWREMFVG